MSNNRGAAANAEGMTQSERARSSGGWGRAGTLLEDQKRGKNLGMKARTLLRLGLTDRSGGAIEECNDPTKRGRRQEGRHMDVCCGGRMIEKAHVLTALCGSDQWLRCTLDAGPHCRGSACWKRSRIQCRRGLPELEPASVGGAGTLCNGGRRVHGRFTDRARTAPGPERPAAACSSHPSPLR
ncbi:hypothetical protein AAFF_G00413620 [Aldrovandia affinis]|uniref:Uncharacterized protein n=1 Tax=Aldrovandia affinis TaxID=143900 RepID=A0AAD7SB50_9TELE|nr:hypothetical protein AAFF_G00413620 [Aldrovandia affinis]